MSLPCHTRDIMDSRWTKIILPIFSIALAAFYIDPALANRFETIGGGVVGSTKIKLEYLKVIAYSVGSIALLASALTVITRKQNAQMLNYTMWKPSTVIFFVLGIAALVSGYAI